MTADLSGSGDARAWPGRAAGSPCTRQLTLPAVAQAAGLARRATSEALASWGVAYLEETAVLIVSELVANVVLHAQASTSLMRLRIETAGTLLRIEVQDAEPCWPRPRTPACLDESGFGLLLVDALAGQWGVRETPAGKAVWAELDTSPGDEAALGPGCAAR